MSPLRSAKQLGIQNCLEFDARLLIPEHRIRELCFENRCGNYGNNYMCPPHIGTLYEIKLRLKNFQRGILLQYWKPLDVASDPEGLRQTKIDFHKKVLKLEERLSKDGLKEMWSMIGGNCALCEVCKVRTAEPCSHPDEARTSLESLAINVVGLLKEFGMDSEFRSDRITWTGCILY
jgi:predicted metal-binding protein